MDKLAACENYNKFFNSTIVRLPSKSRVVPPKSVRAARPPPAAANNQANNNNDNQQDDDDEDDSDENIEDDEQVHAVDAMPAHYDLVKPEDVQNWPAAWPRIPPVNEIKMEFITTLIEKVREVMAYNDIRGYLLLDYRKWQDELLLQDPQRMRNSFDQLCEKLEINSEILFNQFQTLKHELITEGTYLNTNLFVEIGNERRSAKFWGSVLAFGETEEQRPHLNWQRDYKELRIFLSQFVSIAISNSWCERAFRSVI